MSPSKVVWNKSLSIGNNNIDNDHKKLIEIYNDLVDLIEKKWNSEEFAKILSKMTDYSLKHFKKEEFYMSKFDYPKLEEHQQYHKEFIYKIAMYNVELMGNNKPNPREILLFIQNWWLFHILNIDNEYETFRNKTESQATYSSFGS